MIELQTGADGMAMGNPLTANLYPNLESAPGQLYLTPQLMSSREEHSLSRTKAVRSARHVERTSEHIRGGIDKKVNMTVGAQLRVTSTPDWRGLGMERETGIAFAREFGRRAESLFHSWGYDPRCVCDGERHYNFGGMMWLANRNLQAADAECALMIGYDSARARRYNSRWSTFVTVIDPDRIITPPTMENNPNVVDGRRLDEWGAWTSLFISKQYPGSYGWNGSEFDEIPRETAWGRPMALHHFKKYRGAAQRGITTLVNSLKRNIMLDRFDSAQLGAAIVAAAMATYVKTDKDPKEVAANLAPATGNPLAGMDKAEFYARLKLKVGQNRVPVLDKGDELIIASANRATADPTKFRNGFLREFASALGLTFEQFSGNYAEVNYSSARAALIDIWRGILAERFMFCEAVPSPIYGAVIEEAVVKGWLPIPDNLPNFYEARDLYLRCSWTGPALGWVDPKKEAEAVQIRTDPRRPVSTLTQEAAQQGMTFDELVETRAMEEDALREAGLIPEMGEDPVDSIQPSEQDPPTDEPKRVNQGADDV